MLRKLTRQKKIYLYRLHNKVYVIKRILTRSYKNTILLGQLWAEEIKFVARVLEVQTTIL